MIHVKFLSDIPRGQKFIISGFTDPNSEYAKKLIKMGFIEGTGIERTDTTITDPIVVIVRHSRVALRLKEAKNVLVKESE